jgi:aryl-alcohol dehydrogenase-like predicted oxidoreductase
MELLNRREFVGTALAGASVALAAERLRAAEAGPRTPADKVTLGRSGVKVSYVGMGTGVRGWNRQSNSTRMGQPAFSALVKGAFDRGVAFFDSADLYGTHPFLKNALAGIPRHQYAIQSKIWWSKGGIPEPTTDARAAVERFVKELGVEYIDTLLLHCTQRDAWTTDLRPLMDQLAECKQKGLIRAHGTSCHSLGAMKTAAEAAWVDVQLARINNRGKSHLMDGTPEEISKLLQGMRAAGKGVVAMKVFGEGRMKTPEEREASLKFIIEQRCVDAMVIGFEKIEQVDETLGMLKRLLAA